jgi:hypothetical protein
MKSRRIQRELVTVSAMIDMYCRHEHRSENIRCDDCERLAEYAEQRTFDCRFGKDKPVCAKCPVHCYKPKMRQKIREAMRYSGPRMLLLHPYLAVMHIIDKNRFKGENLKLNERTN